MDLLPAWNRRGSKTKSMSCEGFILSNAQVVRENRTQLVFQGRLSDGRRFHWTVTHPGIVFFIDRSESWSPPAAVRKSVDLCSLRGEPVDALYFHTPLELTRARRECESRSISTYEADVNIVSRYLMERFVKGAVSFESEPVDGRDRTVHFIDPVVRPSEFTPALKLLSIDIECSLETDLYSIAAYGKDLQAVLMIDPEPAGCKREYRSFSTEAELLSAFFDLIREADPDALIGWNLVGFDLNWLSRKCAALGIDFSIGTDGPAALLAPGSLFNQWTARIPGRAALDGINMVRSAFVQTEDYSLSTVAKTVLGRKKLIEESGIARAAEITRLFRSDKSSLARYNLEDAKLVYEIFERLNLEKLAVRRSQLTGLALDRIGGSVAAFDFLYLPRLHRYGYVADTHPCPPDGESAPGGLVFDSIPGFYRNVAVFDFKSLYPSIIRTFRVDPLAANAVLNRLDVNPKKENSSAAGRIVRGPAGLEFAEGFAILPSIIGELWQERENAKRLQDEALSHAVKIIMNSFYGVLGTSGCRFYDPRLAGTITRIGHWILIFSRGFIEKEGCRVIYGDTDSLFLHLGEGPLADVNRVGNRLARDLNRYLEKELKRRFDVKSELDIRFEKLFVRFFMPTVRGEEKGSKKRYAGLVMGENGDSELYVAGMESSRRDWTLLAKELQTDIFTLLFKKDGSGDLVNTLRNLVCTRRTQLYSGELDDKLVYRKGISKRLEEYTKNVPPHVRAARMLENFDERIVSYVMTTAGPEPVQKRSGAPYDYDHYSDKQLAPIADMVLQFFGLNYRSITKTTKQLSLFDI